MRHKRDKIKAVQVTRALNSLSQPYLSYLVYQKEENSSMKFSVCVDSYC